MYFKILSVVAAAFLLVACQSSGTSTDDRTGSGRTSDTGRSVGTLPLGDINPLDQRIYFDYDSFELRAESRSVVQAWVDYANGHPEAVFIIEGHADERGTREYNLALGNSRANSAMEYMTALGVAENRLTAITYGKERPTEIGSTEAAYAQNRRSVLVPE